MRIAVIGAGAMGCLYGGLLARAGHDVTLVDGWAAHVAAIGEGGLRLDGLAGDLVVRLPATATAPAGLDAEVAIVCTDSNGTAAAAEAAAIVLAADGVCLPFQNGLGNVEVLEARLGRGRVAAGSSMASAALRAPGHVSYTHAGPTSIGELAGGGSPRLERLVAALEGAGLEARIHPDVTSLLWTKFAHNCAMNALSAITRLRLAEFARVPEMDRLQDRLVDEILAVVAARGITLDEPDFRGSVKDHCWHKFSRPSMLQHIEAGRPSEVGALNGRLVEEARALGVAVPYNDAILCLMRGVERRAASPALSEAEYQALEAAAGERPR